MPELMTVKEVSAGLRASLAAVYRLIKSKKLKAIDISSPDSGRPVYRIFKSSFIQYLHSE